MTPQRSASSRSVWLGIWPLYVLLLEYLAISAYFDAKPLLAAAGSARGLGYLGFLAPAFVVIATVTYILSGRVLRTELAQVVRAAPVFGPARRLALLVNLASFALLWLQTARMFPPATPAGALPSLGTLLAFVFAAAVSALAMLYALVPLDALRRVAPSALHALGLGAGAGLLAWAAGLASEQLWQHLQTATLYSVLALMLPFSDQIVFGPEEAVIGTEDFLVQVAPECSGVEGIGLITVVMAAYLVSARARLRFPRALWLLPFSIALVFIGNAARIALLIAVGVHGSPEVALSGFHSKAGWLFFCAIALSLIAAVQRGDWFARERAQRTASAADSGSWNPVTTYLAPLLALIATSLVTGLFSTGFDRLYGLRIVAVLLALYSQRRHLPHPSWPPSWHAPAIGLAVFALWWWLVPRPAAEHVAALRASIAELGPVWAGVWLALRALGSAITVPIAEELAFRGFLLRRLISSDFSTVDRRRLTPLAVVGSSLAFAALHPGAWVAAGLAGVAYALAQRARGRTGDAIIAHAVTNACIAADVLLWDAYWLWV
ncbi:MAG: exosortase E/protease, VPEID-CTERM system [Polyangiales bacterium]